MSLSLYIYKHILHIHIHIHTEDVLYDYLMHRLYAWPESLGRPPQASPTVVFEDPKP